MENNIKIDKRGEKFFNFMKKYGYYFVAGALIIAITLTVVLTATRKQGNVINPSPENSPIQPVNAYALTFDLPLKDCAVLKAHSPTKLVYNKTLNWFETHHGVDLTSESSQDVLAVAEGTIEKIYSNDHEGTVIVIKHNDVYTSKYGSLEANAELKVGDQISRGQKIGTLSTTAKNELLEGSHIHFELFMDNSEVNPADYLNIESK